MVIGSTTHAQVEEPYFLALHGQRAMPLGSDGFFALDADVDPDHPETQWWVFRRDSGRLVSATREPADSRQGMVTIRRGSDCSRR